MGKSEKLGLFYFNFRLSSTKCLHVTWQAYNTLIHLTVKDLSLCTFHVGIFVIKFKHRCFVLKKEKEGQFKPKKYNLESQNELTNSPWIIFSRRKLRAVLEFALYIIIYIS